MAAVLSCIYVIVMVVVMIGVVRDAILEGLCSTTTIFIIFVAGVFVISAILHPKVNVWMNAEISFFKRHVVTIEPYTLCDRVNQRTLYFF